MTPFRNVLKAAALSPLAVILAGLPVSVWVAIEDSRQNHASFTSQLRSGLSVAATIALFGIPVAYVFVLIVGLPSALLALKGRKPSLWLAVVVGILAAGTFGALLKRGDVDIRTALFYAWYGGVVVASFWRIFRYFEKRRLRQTNGYIGDNVVR